MNLSRSPTSFDALASDLDDLRQELARVRGPADLVHLHQVKYCAWLCTALGLATAWILPNPLSALLLSQGNFTRWTTLAHHILHRGYDDVPDVSPAETSQGFARGYRRWLDWPDLLPVRAWCGEHNLQHHYRLGELADPDQPEQNFEFLRLSRLPATLRLIVVAILMLTWKWIYYAPNLVKEEFNESSKRKKLSLTPLTIFSAALWLPWRQPGAKLWLTAWLPYILFNFLLLPGLFAMVSIKAAIFVWINLVLAEAITNVHSFVMIVPNHAGDDLFRFQTPTESRGEFYFRQIVGSVNYRSGSTALDFMHGWLNYQIEHHLWPDLTLLQYQYARPYVKQICRQHGLQYREESVGRRLIKTLEVVTGQSSMPYWQ